MGGAPWTFEIGGSKGGGQKGRVRRVVARRGLAQPRKRGARRVGARRVGARRVGARRVGARRVWWAQNFAFFFPSLAPIIALFVSLWVSSRGILVVFSKAGPQMCTFGVLGLSCEAPPKRVHLRVSSFKNTTKIPREDLQRGKKRTNVAAGEGKKRAKFWAVQGKGGPGKGGPGKGGPGKGGAGRAETDFGQTDSSQS